MRRNSTRTQSKLRKWCFQMQCGAAHNYNHAFDTRVGRVENRRCPQLPPIIPQSSKPLEYPSNCTSMPSVTRVWLAKTQQILSANTQGTIIKENQAPCLSAGQDSWRKSSMTQAFGQTFFVSSIYTKYIFNFWPLTAAAGPKRPVLLRLAWDEHDRPKRFIRPHRLGGT